ncbi:MAG: hypothetical protein KDB21_15030 [Acidimicrobiales bacterium]|nr:hypothetical protein [Acidimicrobiales bacterium]
MTDTAPAHRLELDDLGDKLESFYVLRKTNSEEASAVLDQLGANSTVDRDIVLELASKRPLGHPDRFWEAHTMAVRALEVLDRNGTRSMPAPKWLGPLGAVPKYLVGIVVGFVVKSHLRSVIDNLRRLYTRRESACMLDDPTRPMLTRARIHTERLTEGFKKNPLGVPGFVLGGAFLSAILSSLQDAFGFLGDSSIGPIIATVVLLLVFMMAVWVFVKGAAVAHRRIKLTTTRPLAALYETIGRCGNPPKDQARMFALGSIALTAVALFVLPVIVALWLF